MTQNFKPALILFIVCSLLDGVISLVMPVDFTYQQLSLISHMAFISMLLCQQGMDLTDRILFSALCGMVTDLFFSNSFPVYTCFYPALSLLYSLPKAYMSSKWARFFTISALCFILDFIPYTICYFLNTTMPFIHEWVYKMEFLTICFNAVMIFVLDFIWQVCLMWASSRSKKKNISLKKKKA